MAAVCYARLFACRTFGQQYEMSYMVGMLLEDFPPHPVHAPVCTTTVHVMQAVVQKQGGSAVCYMPVVSRRRGMVVGRPQWQKAW